MVRGTDFISIPLKSNRPELSGNGMPVLAKTRSIAAALLGSRSCWGGFCWFRVSQALVRSLIDSRLYQYGSIDPSMDCISRACRAGRIFSINLPRWSAVKYRFIYLPWIVGCGSACYLGRLGVSTTQTLVGSILGIALLGVSKQLEFIF
jgi:hypothetical protein